MGVSHDRRPQLQGVVLVTQRLCDGLGGLREPGAFAVVREAIRAGNEREGFRVVAFSVLRNHLHFVVEGWTTRCVSLGMQGLAIRVARALNRYWGRSGKVFVERFHAALVRGMRAVRRVLLYVLQNARRHGVRLPRGLPDPYSSAPWFRFWRERVRTSHEPSPVVDFHDVWLVCAVQGGWLSLDDVPGRGAGPARWG